MRKKQLSSFALMAVLAIQTAQAAETPPSEKQQGGVAIEALPVSAVTGLPAQLRSLQLVQDRMAHGNSRAMNAQVVLLDEMLKEMERGSSLGTMDENQTVFILGMALLNGADPERIRSVLGESGIASKDPFLLATLAYAEGRIAESMTAFELVDPEKLPLSAFAQLQLTIGVILTKTEPEKAIKAFAAARLAAPGTLIEESALRREAMLAIADPKRFLVLLRSYLNRFENSPFASAFISQFAFAISQLEPEAQIEITQALNTVLTKARKTDRQNFYAILARSSLIGGANALTEFATNQALREITNPSMLLSARLYHAAFHVAGADYEKAAAELHSLMRAPLLESDQEILKAAIGVAKELRRWPYDDEPKVVELVRPDKPTNSANSDEKSSSILAAEELLKNTKSIASEEPK
ncbi:MAG: hypothetical protein ACRCT6_08635 [Notoacmeibacter sp.]